MKVKVGDKVRITNMVGDHNEPRYNGRKGTVYLWNGGIVWN